MAAAPSGAAMPAASPSSPSAANVSSPSTSAPSAAAPASVVLATSGYDHTIRFWEAPSGICFRTVQHAESQVNRLEIAPDKRHVAAAGNPAIRLFEVSTNNPAPVASLEGHRGNVTSLGFASDGSWLFSGSEDHTVRIWDIRCRTGSSGGSNSNSGGCQRSFECLAPVNAVALHPNETEIISGDQGGSLRVWDLRANACSRELVPEGEQAIRGVTITPDGKKVCAANNPGRCYIWRLPEASATAFEPLHKLQAHDTYVLKCVFSPDGKLLATCSADHTIRLWRARDVQLVKTLTGHQRWVWDCAFSADSAYLVSASSDQTAKLWDLALGETIRNYTSHNKALTCVALNDVEPRQLPVVDPAGSGGSLPSAAAPVVNINNRSNGGGTSNNGPSTSSAAPSQFGHNSGSDTR